MPDHTTLNVGDRVRLLRVPQADLDQRERERRERAADSAIDPRDAGWTADTLERIIAQSPVVTIAFIDEYGQPWFTCALMEADGTLSDHAIAIMDDDSWCLATDS